MVLQQQHERLQETANSVGRALCEQTLQHLVLVRLELDSLEEGLRAGHGRFTRTCELLEEIASQLTCFSNQLRPKVLEDLGLVAAVDALTQRFSESGIRIELDSGIQKPVPHRIALMLHGALQEALTNVVRHSRANAVCIRLRKRAGNFVCVVQDDGVGFDVSEVLAAGGERGLGLIGLRDNVLISGGDMTIRSAAGHGTELRITLPHSGSRKSALSPATRTERAKTVA